LKAQQQTQLGQVSIFAAVAESDVIEEFKMTSLIILPLNAVT
jgi:hypothetical protein